MFLLAKKIGMTTLFKEGKAENVTLLEVGKNFVVGKRTRERDGYEAIIVNFLYEKNQGKNQDKEKGKKKKKGAGQLKEWRIDDSFKDKQIFLEKIEVGKELKWGEFLKEGKKVIVQGVTKGKGFQGVMKRHNFKGSPSSHGHRHDHRAPGSIGSAFPERVMKGKKMAGRMGGKKATVKNLKIVFVDQEKGLIAINGSVPGNRGSMVSVKVVN